VGLSSTHTKTTPTTSTQAKKNKKSRVRTRSASATGLIFPSPVLATLEERAGFVVMNVHRQATIPRSALDSKAETLRGPS
jgi:hypothetical protein